MYPLQIPLGVIGPLVPSFPTAEKIWLLSKWGIRMHCFAEAGIFKWIETRVNRRSKLVPEDSHLEFFTFAAFTLYELWSTRNQVLHDKIKINEWQIVQSLEKRTQHHLAALRDKTCDTKIRHVSPQWELPSTDWVKINVDATFVDGKAMSAMVVRDSHGLFVAAETQGSWEVDATIAELKALILALKKANEWKLEKDIFESD